MFTTSNKSIDELIAGHSGGLDTNSVKALVIPKGTVLYKLTKYPFDRESNQSSNRNPSPWWSFRDPNAIDVEGVSGRFIQSIMNGIKFTGMVRYMSAVPVEWNTLDWYDEVELLNDVHAAVGLFAVQSWYQGGNGASIENSLAVEKRDTGTVALPANLGALPAWQLYIKDIKNDDFHSLKKIQLETGNEKNITLCHHLLSLPISSNDKRMLTQYLTDSGIGNIGDMHISSPLHQHKRSKL